MTYKSYIEQILCSRGRNGCGNEYFETHHIVPKCMGGDNSKENLIDLYAFEHFEAHRLLCLENPSNKKLAFAWFAMSHIKNQHTKERYKCTAQEYEEIKKLKSELMKSLEHGLHYGCYHTEETKKKMSDTQKKLEHKYWEGKHLPNEMKKKISDSKKKKVFQYDKNKNFISSYSSRQEASRITKVDATHIGKCCAKKRKTAGGFIWSNSELLNL